MELQDLIDASETVESEKREATEAAKGNIEKYLRSQTVTVQELYDVVAVSYRAMHTSSGQVSTWQILDIAKRAILNRGKEKTNGCT